MIRKQGWALILASLVCAVGLLISSQAMAQVATASLNGTVRDSSGAVIPAATVHLRNIATGVEQTTVTNGVGRYVLLNLQPGGYDLSVRKKGFKSSRQTNITLTVNQTATFNFTLPVGATTQTVTVQATPIRIQASTAELGTVVMRREVNDLPLNGRNFTQLLLLSPGVSPINKSQNWTHAVGAYSKPAVQGQSNRSNMFLLDGVNDANSMGGSYAVQPILDDVQEFKVDSHNDQVQFGGVTGGIVNLVMKSGTNHFHGTLWEFVRNTAFDARTPTETKVGRYNQNQFGGNIGGPVILPHYNGRNKTFFFFGFEKFIHHTASESLFFEPTAAQWNGDFTGIPETLYNPYTTQPDPNKPGQFLRDPFYCDGSGNPLPAVNGLQSPVAGDSPCNKIPQSMIDPTTAAYQPLYPAPVNTGFASYNGRIVNPSITDALSYDIKIDQKLGTKNSFWFRYSSYSKDVTSKPIFIGSQGSNIFPSYNLAAHWLHTFSPTMVLTADFGRVHAFAQNTTYISGAANIPKGFSPGYACGFGGPKSCMIPSVSISGYAGGGESSTHNNVSNIYLGKANLAWIHGNHTFQMGGALETNNQDSVLATLTEGYNIRPTANLESVAGTGDAFASFLLGLPDASTRRSRVNNLTGGWVDSAYFQDQWKAAKHLTLNLGIRYDVSFLPVLNPSITHSNLTGGIDFNNGTYIVTKDVASLGSCASLGQAPCLPGGTLPPNVVTASGMNIVSNDYGNIQPRFGVAYALNSKTAIRGSYGIFTNNWAAIDQMAQNYGGLWPGVGLVRNANTNTDYPTVFAASPLGLGNKINPLPAADPFGQVAYYMDPKWKNSYAEEWNFGIERQLGASTLVKVDYVGSHSLHLPCCNFYNTAITPGAGSYHARAPYPNIVATHYDRPVAWGNYNALQASINRRATHGLSYLISYTWSKAMDVGCDGFFGVEGCTVQDPYNLQASYSVAGYDLTHIFSANWVYELPFGKGQRFATPNRIVNLIAGGWRLNGIFNLRSGSPYTVGCGCGDVANTGNNVQLVNLVGYPYASSTQLGLNTAAFQAPAPLTWGTEGRNALRGPWVINTIDLSVLRDFKITESKRLEFRASAFNAPNRTYWGAPVSNFSNRFFGQVRNKSGGGRLLQLALKLYF